MIPEKPAPHLMRGVKRFSEKIMRQQARQPKKRFPPIALANDPDYQIAGTEIYCGAG
jgi:hypothetical protein